MFRVDLACSLLFSKDGSLLSCSMLIMIRQWVREEGRDGSGDSFLRDCHSLASELDCDEPGQRNPLDPQVASRSRAEGGTRCMKQL